MIFAGIIQTKIFKDYVIYNFRINFALFNRKKKTT